MEEPKEIRSDVVLLPGIPDIGIEQVSDGRWAYPSTTADVAKILREQGLEVRWAYPKDERVVVSYKAFELWLPILFFAREALASGVGDIFATMVVRLLGSKSAVDDAILHVEFKVKTGDDVRTFKGTGRGQDVLKAIKEFDANA